MRLIRVSANHKEANSEAAKLTPTPKTTKTKVRQLWTVEEKASSSG